VGSGAENQSKIFRVLYTHHLSNVVLTLCLVEICPFVCVPGASLLYQVTRRQDHRNSSIVLLLLTHVKSRIALSNPADSWYELTRSIYWWLLVGFTPANQRDFQQDFSKHRLHNASKFFLDGILCMRRKRINIGCQRCQPLDQRTIWHHATFKWIFKKPSWDKWYVQQKTSYTARREPVMCYIQQYHHVLKSSLGLCLCPQLRNEETT
jgi:hypothetical protein